MNEQKFDHVIALIGAALRHRQEQPWMYEALALALDAAGRPKAEIERAVMSAVDFVDNTGDLMYIGAYLAQIGLNQRALQVYRQAAAIDPIRPEPYMLGLRAARALDDLDGLKWASLGILSQAWPKEQADIWQAGMGVAREVLDKLRAEKQTKEADAVPDGLGRGRRPRLRGDCHVDRRGRRGFAGRGAQRHGMFAAKSRTTAGGVLLGDAITQAGRDSFGGHSEIYVCPKGFNGTYRLLVRRVWGDVTAGKVNVEVMTHYRTANAVDVRKKIALDKDEALVAFDLTGGRRKEPLHQQQVANAVAGQLALNRQILAQQLDSSVDPRCCRPWPCRGRPGARAAARAATPSLLLRGAVGYQPVIITLPEGANLMVTAVISADRRYVRITPMPFFSGVGRSHLQYVHRRHRDDTGGTGGQGFSGSNSGGTGGGGGLGGIGGICFGGLFQDVNDAPGSLFPYRGQCGGVVVVTVQPGSPGEKAGLCPGDIIYRFEGRPVPSTIRSRRCGTT